MAPPCRLSEASDECETVVKQFHGMATASVNVGVSVDVLVSVEC